MGDKPFLRLVAVPAIGWIRAYKPNESPRDLVAGLSLAAFVIPESLAYASLAQLPPVTGLYCYLVAGIAYAVFGTSRQLAVGPTSALAITVATSVIAMADGDLSRALTLASALALIVGVVCIAGRFLGLANMAYFISDAILIGFKTGAAIYIASTQLPKLFGIEGISGNVFERFGHVVLSLHETHVFSLVVGLAAIALFATFGRIFPGPPDDVVCRCRGHCSDERVRAGRDRHQDRRRNSHWPAGNQRAECPSIRYFSLAADSTCLRFATAVGAEQDLGPIPAHRTIEDCLRHGAGSSIPMKGTG